jgi:putative transposase
MQMLAEEYPITQMSEVLEVARSTYYHLRAQSDEQEVRQAIAAVAAEYPRYGYRRITHQLRRQGQIVNHQRVERIMRERGLQARRRSKRKGTTNSAHAFPRYPNRVEDLEIVRPDQVWVCDITYIRLLEEFVYLAVLMDVFTRGMRGWHLGRSLDPSLTWRALDQALVHHTPEIHHSEEARAVCSYRLYSPAASSRSADQHGRGRSCVAKWRGLALDAHNQRRGG